MDTNIEESKFWLRNISLGGIEFWSKCTLPIAIRNDLQNTHNIIITYNANTKSVGMKSKGKFMLKVLIWTLQFKQERPKK